MVALRKEAILLGSFGVGLLVLIIATHWGEVHATTLESLSQFPSQTRVEFNARLQSTRFSESTVRFDLMSSGQHVTGYARDFNVLTGFFPNELVRVNGVIERPDEKTTIIRVIRLEPH